VLADAAAKRGCLSMVLDLADSLFNDLGRPCVYAKLLKVIPECSLLCLDIPCNTWSRARRGPPSSKLPRALRSDAELWGLKGLSPRDEAKVRSANHMIKGCLRLVRAAIENNVGGYLENPLTSRLWLVPAIQSLVKRQLAVFIDLDMCQYDTQWRKPTRLLVWGPSRHSFELRRCQGRAGICSRTHKPHLKLSGLANGAFVTAQAQVYTWAFSDAVVRQLLNGTAGTARAT